ncbi:MAG: UDP-N-acetylmuramate dehydrogenase [Candidatus Pacebacteria bacterium]|jgi:UDP-N-acetylmuramate dehydrogenase|nr:UDP-N-acetylmuramate dehydrogenase [Candidatus Paceibacterota bacterium]
MSEEQADNIKLNEPLSKYCTYRIGGPAKCLFFAGSAEQIIAGLEVARDNKFPFFVLGGGSNVLFSDNGFDGLVLKIESNYVEPAGGETLVRLNVGAGTPLAALARYAADNSLTGMEWAAGIPGTVGGAIRGNAGAFHQDISEAVVEVQAAKIGETGIETVTIAKPECKFSYRESVFKNDKNLVIVSALVRLRKGNKQEIESLMKEYLAKKSTTQPLDYPSAGSVFVNPEGFFAAKLIEDCGFKGKTVGGAKVSEKHSNFIINGGNATARDVKDLIGEIKKSAKEKFNVDLKEEIEIV